MKRNISLCLLLLSILPAQAQDTKYRVTLISDPAETLYAYAYSLDNSWGSNTEFSAGEKVKLAGMMKSEYSFVSWTDEQGTVVSDSLDYTFTMPARDVTLTGHTVYNPENPPGPHEDGYIDSWQRLYLRSLPEYGGTFSWGAGAESGQNWQVWEGYEFTVTAYPATGFKFAGFQVDGQIVSTENPYTFTMPGRDMTLYAVYDYDPETPPMPHGNEWNKESGNLIMSDFTPGKLEDQIGEVTRLTPWSSGWQLIKNAIVDGPCLQQGDGWTFFCDWEAFRFAEKVEFLDYSRTSGLTHIPSYCFRDKEQLATIVLPATVDSIGPMAFRNCTALSTITCFAATPPLLGGVLPDEEHYGMGSYQEYGWPFDGLNTDDIIVYVPAESVPLYQAARGWKEFVVQPIAQGISQLSVSLPQADSYKDMFLELVNTKTLTTIRYVVTPATTYTFNNLIHGTSYNLYLKNQRGSVLGKKEGIDIVDKDVAISLSDIAAPCDITLRLLAPEGLPVSESGYAVTWTDRQGNYLGSGTTLEAQAEGSQVRFHVKPDEALGRQYLMPQDSLVTMSQGSPLSITLQPFPQTTLSGAVTAAADGNPVRSATVTVSQLLNDLYAESLTVRTDAQGHWTMTVYQAPATITVSHNNFLKASSTMTAEEMDGSPSVNSQLRDLSGTIVDLDLYYRAAIHDGEESISDEYHDWANVTYSVYDVSHQAEVTQFSVQYPMLVLVDQELEQGTRLRVTATSIDKTFMPVATECTVDSNGRATATLPVVEMGKIEASFEMTDNESAVALLFNDEEQLVGWAPYTGVSLSVGSIPDGRYRLITLGGGSVLSTSFNTFWALDNIGMREGADYVQNIVEVESGKIAVVKNHLIPHLDETAFLYTGSQTSFSVNKQEVTVGQYVTVKGQVDFKPGIEAENVQLLFDLPEGCQLVDGSVMVGNQTASYSYYDHRVRVDVASGEAVRFCVVPLTGGTYQVSALVSADLNGANTRQPIGQAIFTAEDLTISIPSTTGRRLLPVTGMAVPLSKVEVYDNDVVIAETTSLGTGYWSVMCPLDRPYNLSEHSIYAVVTTPEGMQMQSETKTVTVNRGSLTPVVTLELIGTRWEHHQKQFVFDFRTNEVSPSGMKLTDFGDFNLDIRVDFYDENDLLVNDTTVIRDVTLYTLTEHGDVAAYPLSYNQRYKCWYQLIDTDGTNLPVNVDLDYSIAAPVAIDRQEFDDLIQQLVSYAEESRQRMLDTYHMYDEIGDEIENQGLFSQLESLLAIDAPTDADLDRIETLVTQLVGSEAMADAETQMAIDFSEIDALQAKDALTDAELEQLEALIDARMADVQALASDSISEEQLAQLLAELESSYKALTESTRDSLMCLSALFYLPDTTAVVLPNGDVSMLLVGETRSAQLDIKNLESIDREQLLANGFTEVPTTDGNYFYYLATGDAYQVVDVAQKKLYSKTFIDTETAAVRRKEVFWGSYLGGLSLSAFLPRECFKEFDDISRHIAKTAEQLRQSTDAPSVIINVITNLIPIVADVEGIMKCLYDIGRNNLDIHIMNAYNNGMKKFNGELTKFKEQFQKAQKALSLETTKLKRLQTMKDRLGHQVNYYRSRLSRAATSAEIIEWQTKLTTAQDKLLKAGETLRSTSKNLKSVEQAFKNTQRFLGKAEKALANFTKFSDGLLNLFRMLPVKLIPDKSQLKTIPWSIMEMPVIGPIVKLFPAVMVVIDNVQDMSAWGKTHKAVLAKMPCEGQPQEAQQLLSDCEFQFGLHGVADLLHIGVDLTAWVVDVFKVAPSNWLLAKALDATSCLMGTFHPAASQNARQKIEQRLKELDCEKDPEPEPKPNTNDPNGDWVPSGGTLGGADFRYNHPTWKFPRLWFARDPSGFVYEAVSSNRVEGVTATCYYKETKEDMYGDLYDEAVVWDAERYAQENPLFTDADGRYQWDVPTGLWQVKYEKAGYETTYSDWLPVPPPQLEVNVGITQLRQPAVQKVKAYTDGIDITFDKYMRPETLTGENIFVTQGGQRVSGTIDLLNAEDGYQKPGVKYASKVRFNVNDNANLNLDDKVVLMVKKAVESYAGLQMEQDFSQQFGVEQRVVLLVADTLVNMSEDKELSLTVRALPAEAASGKHLTATTSAPEVVTLFPTEPLTIDEHGEAHLTVASHGQGSSIVRFRMTEDDDLTTATQITVRDPSSMMVASPRSSRLNGVTMYFGSEIRLSCSTTGATIRYTLDGSCPCDPQGGQVLTYDGPITITTPELTIKAMAVVPGMEDSPVVEFTYKGIERPTAIEAPTVDDGSPVVAPQQYFRLDGRRIARPERGVNIERQENGTVKKVTIK